MKRIRKILYADGRNERNETERDVTPEAITKDNIFRNLNSYNNNINNNFSNTDEVCNDNKMSITLDMNDNDNNQRMVQQRFQNQMEPKNKRRKIIKEKKTNMPNERKFIINND